MSVPHSTRPSHDHERHHKLQRALQVCRLIAHEALTLREIAEGLRCSPRTVRRAIYALQASGVDILVGREAEDLEDEAAQTPRPRRFIYANAYRLDWRAWAGLPICRRTAASSLEVRDEGHGTQDRCAAR